jgi:nucleosome binding factor SPN SPT16 subunit
VKKIEDIIDKEREVTHDKIASMCEDFFQDATKISSKLEANVRNGVLIGLSLKVVDSCYMPIIQSGGKYNLNRFAENYPDTLDFGTIIVSLGGRYKVSKRVILSNDLAIL